MLRIQKQDPEAVSQTLIDKASQNRESAQAEIQSLTATVDRAKDDLSYTYLKAPYDGIITQTYREAFENVRRKQPVVLVAATTVLGVMPLLKDVFWVSMSVTIMAGLAFGTLLTLFVVPVLYTI